MESNEIEQEQPAVETPVYIDDEPTTPVVEETVAVEPTDEPEQPAAETVAVEPTDDEAAMIAASQATNAKHIAVAAATIEQAVPDSQVSLLQELEDLAEEIGGVRQEQILAISMRMRAVLAAVG
jgi:hypothetical protein